MDVEQQDHGLPVRSVLGAVVTGLVTVCVLGACANGAAPVAGGAAPAVASATPAGSPSAAGTPTATATTSGPSASASSAVPVSAGYDAARGQWQLAATAVSAQQGLYWSKAADDLHAGAATDTGDVSGYPAAITRLKELISLPDGQQTPAQNTAYHADITALNAFFNTPGLYR